METPKLKMGEFTTKNKFPICKDTPEFVSLNKTQKLFVFDKNHKIVRVGTRKK